MSHKLWLINYDSSCSFRNLTNKLPCKWIYNCFKFIQPLKTRITKLIYLYPSRPVKLIFYLLHSIFNYTMNYYYVFTPKMNLVHSNKIREAFHWYLNKKIKIYKIALWNRFIQNNISQIIASIFLGCYQQRWIFSIKLAAEVVQT